MVKKIKILILVFLIGGLFFGGLRVFAVDNRDMSYMMMISPPVEKIILMPGEVYNGSIDVSNPSTASKDLKYSVSVGSFGFRDDENGNTDYNNTDVDTITGYNQMMEWITLGKESGSVAPGTTDAVSYTVTVPEDAPAGGQYASIIFRDETGKDDGNNEGIAIENVVEFAASILAEVAGETREEGIIIDNNVPSFLLSNQLEATSMVRNEGNVHTDAEYTLQVWPLFSDEEICTNEENSETSIIMPETERYNTQTCDLPAIGVFKAKQTVKIFGETSVVERMVIVCPIWLMFIIIFVIFALIFYFVAKVKARKKAAKKAEKSA